MLSHPLEFDGVSALFFNVISKENKRDLQSCRVQCPLTVLFEQGFAKASFQTESRAHGNAVGELKRKAGREIDVNELFSQYTRGTVEGDIVAVLLYAAPRQAEMNYVRFMDRNDLKHFLFQEIEKPRSLLQKFVRPKGSSNTLVHAVWSPLMVLAEGRRNRHSLNDRHLSPTVRGVTFEAVSSTTEVVVANAVVKEITNVCRTIADHYEKTERLTVNRIGAFFKVDEQNRLQLLFPSSLRIQDSVSGRNAAPISLAHAIRVPSKGNSSRDDQAAEQKLLADAAKRESSLRISIPSMPDTSTLLLQSIHHNQGNVVTSPDRRSAQSPGRTVKTPSPIASRRTPQASVAHTASSPPALMSPVSIRSTSPRKRLVEHASPTASIHSEKVARRALPVGPGSPLPQPRPLLKYQHILPNSEANLKLNMQKAELGLTEPELRMEWDAFLAEQQRQLRMLQAGAAGEDTVSTAADGPSGASAGVVAATPGTNRHDVNIPPVRSIARFAAGHRIESPRPSTVSLLSPTAAESMKEKALPVTASPATTTSPRAAEDRAAFIAAWRAAHHALQADSGSPRRIEEPTAINPPNAPDSSVRVPVQVPKSLGIPGSVLLPPFFSSPVRGSVPKIASRLRTSIVGAAGASIPAQQHSPSSTVTHSGKVDGSRHAPVQQTTPVRAAPSTHTVPRQHRNEPKPPAVQRDAAQSQEQRHVESMVSCVPAGVATHHSQRPIPVDTTPTQLFRRLHAVAAQRDACLSEGMDDTQLTHIEHRARAICDLFGSFIKELHYALYCFFLNTQSGDAYIEVPEMFRCCVTSAVMCTLLHRLHGHVEQRRTYLEEHSVAENLLVTRSILLGQLHSGALSAFPPPPCADEVELEQGDALIIPQFEGRFLVLRGEDAMGDANEDLMAFINPPDGVIYDAAYRHCLYSYIAEAEGKAELDDRIRRADEASLAMRTSPQTESLRADTPLNVTPHPNVEHCEPIESVTVPSPPNRIDDRFFCYKCQACTMCCVCSIVKRRSSAAARRPTASH